MFRHFYHYVQILISSSSCLFFSFCKIFKEEICSEAVSLIQVHEWIGDEASTPDYVWSWKYVRGDDLQSHDSIIYTRRDANFHASWFISLIILTGSIFCYYWTYFRSVSFQIGFWPIHKNTGSNQICNKMFRRVSYNYCVAVYWDDIGLNQQPKKGKIYTILCLI